MPEGQAAIQKGLDGLEKWDIKYLIQEWVDGQHCRGNEYLPVTITLFSEKKYVLRHNL